MTSPAPFFHRPLKPRLRPGEPLVVNWLAMGSVAMAELAAQAAPDALVIDLQHGLWERSTLEAAIGIANASVPVIARTADNSLNAIGGALDAGAAAVLAPLIETADDARAIVEAGRYPPLGRRSGGGIRPLRHGVAGMVEADRHVALGALVETARGVANIEAICAVEGLDFIFIGSGDLALSRGVSDPSALAPDLARIRQVAHAHGLPCGLFTVDAAAARRALAEGFDIVVAANDIDVVARGFSNAVQACRAAGTP